MKHIITLLLMVAFSAIVHAQDCMIQTSVLVRADYYQSHDKYNNGYRGQNDGFRTWDKRKKFIQQHGLTEEMHNTRLAIAFNYISGPRSLQLRVSLYDTENSVVLYSLKLDTCYADQDVFDLAIRMDNDLFTGLNQQFNNALDTIYAQIIAIYETNKSPWMSTVKKHLKDGYPDWALFQLDQFPKCAPSYPQLQPFIAATLREYVKKYDNELLKLAKLAWNEQQNETDARFVVALLNCEKMNERDRKKADKILQKVAETYPNIDIKAHEDYCITPELAAVAARLAHKIALEFSERYAPETHNYIPEV